MPRYKRKSAVRPATGRVTMKDVADHVGVSSITVSRALSQPEKVSKPLYDKIMQAVDELGYQCNAIAGALASNRLKVIPIIVPRLENAVFAQMIEGLSEAVEAQGYTILLGNSRYSLEREERLIRTFLSWSPSGIVVTGTNQSAKAKKMLSQAGIPVAQVLSLSKDAIDINVGIDSKQAGEELAETVCSKGVKRVCLASSVLNKDIRAVQRKQAMAATFKRNGVEVVSVAADQLATFNVGRQLGNEIISMHPKIDAVCASNDILAVGIMKEYLSQNFKIPDDVFITGFNGTEVSQNVHPALTTVSVPFWEIGYRVGELIVKRQDESAFSPVSEKLSYRIIDGETL